MDDCVFCKIARGELGAHLVYEDEAVVAFNDRAPQAPVHVLVIPREHHEHLGDGVPAQTAARLLAAVPEVARRAGLADRGYRVIVNSGRDGNQTVPHLHLHVMGGRQMSHGMVMFEGAEDG
ncbi:MAG TPA: histidine triad nucleotide-binding protein [Coriobacteriia bacterium]|nr:histidine triad nucleotide-binding protein [Coriobacteriia bacterium]